MLVALKPLDHVCSDRLAVPLVELCLRSFLISACKVKLNAVLRLHGEITVVNRNFKRGLCYDLLKCEVICVEELNLLSRPRDGKRKRLRVEAW